MLGDVKSREFFGVTENNSQKELINILNKNFVNKGIEIVVANMYMDRRFKGAIRSLQVKKEIPIVIDKFHVIKHINRVIDLCRVAVEKSNNERFLIKRTLPMKTETLLKIKQKLRARYHNNLDHNNFAGFSQKDKKLAYRVQKFEKILQEYPEIKILWDLKNKIHGFYKCKSLHTATKSWTSLLLFLDIHVHTHPEFVDLQKTLQNWECEILNYFIFRTTNAYIEGLNNRIETLKRKKFGFRNKLNFLKCLCYALLPVSLFFQNLIFTHFL